MLNEEKTKKPPEADFSEKEEKGKYFVLWSGLCFFSILILLFCFLNTKNFFSSVSKQKEGPSDIKKAEADFNKSLEAAMSKIKELKAVQIPADFKAPAIGTSTAE